MASQKEIKQRIVSVASTRQITGAMKMVSASKLRKVQEKITRLRPYTDRMKAVLSRVAESLDDTFDNPYLTGKNTERVLVVVITSQRGLCGALNGNVVKKALDAGRRHDRTHFLPVGKKGADLLRRRGCFLVESPVECLDTPTFEQAGHLATCLMESYTSGQYSRIELTYSQFRNAVVNVPTTESFLPLQTAAGSTATKGKSAGYRADHIFEPDATAILRELIPQTLKLHIYKALTDASASEHGARMTTMTQATDNASNLIGDLTLQYNKARQAAITGELSEIVGGAAALQN